MTFHDDPEDRDLERRIRSIADSPQPPVPGSVLRYASEVTRHKRGSRMHFSPGFPFGRGPARLASALGVAATLVVAVVLAGVLISQRSHQTGPSSSNSPSASATGSAKATSSTSIAVATQTPHVSIPAGTPGPTLTNVGFETPGLAIGWTGFSWTSLAANSPMIANPDLAGSGISQVLKWQGGYAATGSNAGPGNTAPSTGLWLSPDGQVWAPAKNMPAEPRVMVAVAGAGLVVIGIDASGTAKSVDTTADGISWSGTDVLNLPGSVVSIAGTSTGIVATVAVTTGTGKFASTNYLVEFSTDGASWSPETIQPSLSWNPNSPAPTVQSNAGRFFLLGSTTSPLAQVGGTGIVFASSAAAPSYVWWSDDGRTWTRSGGSFEASPQRIDFGRDGMLLETSWNAVPGGTELARSTDGGKTWKPDANFGPLGPATCTVQCSTGPDGVIGSNGTYFVAVKNGGKNAWTSFDGATWTPIPWGGPDPATIGLGSFVVLPSGMLVGDRYGAAR